MVKQDTVVQFRCRADGGLPLSNGTRDSRHCGLPSTNYEAPHWSIFHRPSYNSAFLTLSHSEHTHTHTHARARAPIYIYICIECVPCPCTVSYEIININWCTTIYIIFIRESPTCFDPAGPSSGRILWTHYGCVYTVKCEWALGLLLPEQLAAPQLVNKFSTFMEPEGSSPHSQHFRHLSLC
jgi:hypothetical protein